jgi:hypothetical protein
VPFTFRAERERAVTRPRRPGDGRVTVDGGIGTDERTTRT